MHVDDHGHSRRRLGQRRHCEHARRRGRLCPGRACKERPFAEGSRLPTALEVVDCGPYLLQGGFQSDRTSCNCIGDYVVLGVVEEVELASLVADLIELGGERVVVAVVIIRIVLFVRTRAVERGVGLDLFGLIRLRRHNLGNTGVGDHVKGSAGS